MARPKSEWLAQVPDDWDQTNNSFHGFSRRNVDKTYVVSLTLLQCQYHLSYHKDQVEAARAYDAALWLLLPFAPAKSRPNFPNDFESISRKDVAALCPYAGKLHETLSDRAVSAGIPIEGMREARMKALREQTVTDAQRIDMPARNVNMARAFRGYDQLMVQLTNASIYVNELAAKLPMKAAALDLRKLPTPQQKLGNCAALAQQLATELMEAFGTLNDHREYYQKIKSGGGSPE